MQILRGSECPPLVARGLLLEVLADFRETGNHYLMHLLLRRQETTCHEEFERIDEALREFLVYDQIPQRWQLNRLFSLGAYKTFGEGLILVWANALMQICVLEQHWEDILLGLPPRDPSLLPGWHPDEEVYSAEWLADFRPSWAAEIELSDRTSNIQATWIAEPKIDDIARPGCVH